MYQLKTEADFDSAHFLSGYTGKCSNIHGHRWHVEIEIESRKLEKNGQERGMLVDFGDLKKDLKELADSMDHTLIYEENTLRPKTLEALESLGTETYLTSNGEITVSSTPSGIQIRQ